MFPFPAFAPTIGRRLDFIQPGCPIRIFTDQFLFADPRNFSQLTTSFFASRSLGIHRSPFSTFSRESRALLSCGSPQKTRPRLFSCFAYEIAVLPSQPEIDSRISEFQTDFSIFFTSYSLSMLSMIFALFRRRLP